MKKIFLTLTFGLFIIPIGISQDLPSYVPTNGLVAYYPFNGNANDESGNGYHGTVNGATLTTDRNNNADNAYVFDNSNIEIPHQFYSNGWNDYTINLWFLTSDKTVSSQAILNTIPHDGEGLNFNHPHHINVFSHYKSSDLNIDNWDIWSGNEFSINVENNIWYMISIVKHNDEYNYYINNQLISSSINALSAQNQLTGLTIGSITQENNNQENLLGKLDDIGIWNKALSQEEMQNLYASSTGDILLNGTVSAENNQIKNVADPTEAQDAVTLNYLENSNFYTQNQVDNLLDDLRDELGNQIDNDGDGYTEDEGDCDDSDLEVNPAAGEISDDGIDNDCDGQIDELVPNYVPSNGLVAFYPFAGDLEDKSGNEYHLNNSNVYFTGDANLTSNHALYFNGNSSHLYTSTSFSELTSDPNQTISFWFKNISDNWRAIFTIGDSDGARIVVIPNTINEKIAVIGTDDCHLCGESGGSEGIDIEVNNFKDGWHHIVVSTNSNELKLYLNGNLISTTNHSGFNCDNDNYRLWLGNDIVCAPEWFEMNMDDVGIWDRELSAGEINNLYQKN